MAPAPQAFGLSSCSHMRLPIAPSPLLGIPALLTLFGTLCGWTHLSAPPLAPQVITSTWIPLLGLWALPRACNLIVKSRLAWESQDQPMSRANCLCLTTFLRESQPSTGSRISLVMVYASKGPYHYVLTVPLVWEIVSLANLMLGHCHPLGLVPGFLLSL